MKARIKATDRIIEVMCVMNKEGVTVWEDISGISTNPNQYHSNELEFLDFPEMPIATYTPNKNEDEFHNALRKYSENFNSLPLEVRKGLPDLFMRWQEVTFLIKEQEKVLRHLKERQKYLIQQALNWYHKKSIYKEK